MQLLRGFYVLHFVVVVVLLLLFFVMSHIRLMPFILASAVREE
jgi:hypothetical protein